MLWRAVEKVIPDIRQRTEVELVGWTALYIYTVCGPILLCLSCKRLFQRSPHSHSACRLPTHARWLCIGKHCRHKGSQILVDTQKMHLPSCH